MDVETFKRKPNRELKAGFISKIFFWWLNPIFCQGFKRDLGPDDLFELCPEDEANVVAARLEKSVEVADFNH